MPATRYAILVYQDFPMLAFAALIEPLRAANMIAGRDLYSWQAVSDGVSGDGASQNGQPHGGAASNGFQITPVQPIGPDTAADRIIVCSGGDADRVPLTPVAQWLRQADRRGAQIGAVADGAFLLARTGLLDGYRCTLHWSGQASFAESFPKVALEHRHYVIDRNRFTALGGVGSLDLMIEMIRRDHDAHLAAEVAGWFSHSTLLQPPNRSPLPARMRSGIREPLVLAAMSILDNRGDAADDSVISATKVRISDVAQRLGVSVRRLERLFRAEMGMGPGQYLRQQRLDRAHDLIAHSSLSLREIAVAVGYGDMTAFGRAIRQHYGASPSVLRRRLRPQLAQMDQG